LSKAGIRKNAIVHRQDGSGNGCGSCGGGGGGGGGGCREEGVICDSGETFR